MLGLCACSAEKDDDDSEDKKDKKERKEKEVEFLTQEEVDRIRKAKMPTEGLEKIRDLFLFQCYCNRLRYNVHFLLILHSCISQQVSGKPVLLCMSDCRFWKH